jgi:glycosyltransferase involved in cell wall biosynthesis
MTVCLFGSYTTAEGYPVNRVLRQGLRLSGVEVAECRAEVWGRFVHELLANATPWRLVMTLWRMARGLVQLSLQYARTPAHDWVLIGYPGYLDVRLARWLIGRRRQIVLVSFISLFDTAICDRRNASETSWMARLLKWLDASAFRAADIVLVDTDAQGDYYAKLFSIERQRFVRSFVGEDDEQFASRPLPPRLEGEPLRVLFFGTYVPLHGIETIIEAAALLQGDEVDFTLIGSGQEFDSLQARCLELGGRVQFISQWQSSDQLHDHIVHSHVCLGVFGTTAKAARVIPYKVFDALAVGRPVITRDSPAIRELLVHDESVVLCPPGDAAALAGAITRLRDEPSLAREIAASGHEVYTQHGSPAAIGRQLLCRVEMVN